MTTDAALHTYHILFDYALRSVEADKLIDGHRRAYRADARRVPGPARMPASRSSGTSARGTWRSSPWRSRCWAAARPAYPRRPAAGRCGATPDRRPRRLRGIADLRRHGGLQPVRAPGPLHPERRPEKIFQGHDVVRPDILLPVQGRARRWQGAGQRAVPARPS